MTRTSANVTGNQDADGLDTGVKQNRNSVNTDLAASFTVRFHHVPHTEDWPPMPVLWHPFSIRPFDLFPKNTGMDRSMQP
ncbi:MAG: copper amine oxidase [Acidobacteriaceae bacterium]